VKLPFVVITGFLGSGKTTLLNRVLARRATGARDRLGVIVNELGAVGIDGDLLGGEAARQVELPGGCVCCALGDDLARTVIELADANPDLGTLVLETTGVAEPLPIAWATEHEPLASRVRLAAIVTLLDAENFVASRTASAAVDAQVRNADVLLVTKAQLADPAAAIAAARTLNPRAEVRVGTTDEHAAWLDALLTDPPVSAETATLSSESRTHSPIGQGPAHGEPGHVHDETCRDSAAHGIDSVWIPAAGELDLEELEDALAALPANYVRIKGIVFASDGRVADGAARWIAVHRVGLRVSSEPTHADLSSVEARLVALGHDVDRAALARCVEAAAFTR
jgi:G3E family GTPase